VQSVNVDEYLDRFQVKAIGTGRLKPESITAYRSRFSRAIDYYTKYLASGEVPKFRLQSGGGTSTRRRTPPTTDGATAQAEAGRPSVAADAAESESKTGMITYPFPLESGDIANVRLPRRLRRADAERLAAFIRTLVFEPQKELERGRHPENES